MARSRKAIPAGGYNNAGPGALRKWRRRQNKRRRQNTRKAIADGGDGVFPNGKMRGEQPPNGRKYYWWWVMSPNGRSQGGEVSPNDIEGWLRK